MERPVLTSAVLEIGMIDPSRNLPDWRRKALKKVDDYLVSYWHNEIQAAKELSDFGEFKVDVLGLDQDPIVAMRLRIKWPTFSVYINFDEAYTIALLTVAYDGINKLQHRGGISMDPASLRSLLHYWITTEVLDWVAANKKKHEHS